MATADDFVKVAQQYIGYQEKKTCAKLDSKTANAGHKNFNRFARDLKKVSGWSWLWQGSAWCCEFVCACAAEAVDWDKEKAQKLFGGSAEMSCNRLLNQMKKAGKKTFRRGGGVPQKGDFCFCNTKKLSTGKYQENSMGHIGLVEKVEGGYVHTIEGNSGDKVQRHKMSASSTRIYGYARPGWDKESEASSAEPAQSEYKYMRGVDVSSHDVDSHKKHTDPLLASRHCKFEIVKHTEGTTYANPYRTKQYQAAKGSGKLLGSYHYANGNDPKKEAAYYFEHVEHTIGEAIPFLDWEGGNNPAFKWSLAKRRAWIKQFADEFERLSGVRPGGYVQLSRICDILGIVPIYWGAGYPVSAWDKWSLPTYIYSKMIELSKLHIWQYTSAGGTDRNVCYMTSEQWKNAAKPNEAKKQTESYNKQNPTASSTAKRTYQVTAKSGLNVRTGAGTQYRIKDIRPCGAKFDSSKRRKDAQGRTWAHTSKGWICLGKPGAWYVKRLKQ